MSSAWQGRARSAATSRTRSSAARVCTATLQAQRIEAIRRAVGDQFFINARTDLYIKTETHDSALVDEAIERGSAFADAGASGFFIPRLVDPRQIERIVKEVPLPLNLIALSGTPPKADWADASHESATGPTLTGR